MNLSSRSFSSALLLAAFLMPLLATPVQAQDPSQIRPAEPPVIPPPEPAVKAAAETMLRQAMEAFKNAPAITCKTTVVVTSGENKSDLVVESIFGPGGGLRVEVPDALFVVADGYLNIVDYKVPDRYIRVPVSEKPSDDILTIFGERALAGFEVLMREGQPQEVWTEAIMMRSVGVPRVIGLEQVTTADGKVIQRIGVAGRLGAGTIDYDPASKTILGVRSSLYPPEGLDDFSWNMTMVTKTTFLDALPEPITFDPGKRTPVSTRQQLDIIDRNRLRAGQNSPALQLPQLDGGLVTLADLKGKIVVLDFWATWCGPCKRGLPKLNQLYLEQGENRGDVRVYAVNVMEREPMPADRMELVSSFWEKNGYEVPTLVAPDDTLSNAWGIRSIPMLVIISPDGIVAEVIQGLRPGMKEQLEKAIDALKTKS